MRSHRSRRQLVVSGSLLVAAGALLLSAACRHAGRPPALRWREGEDSVYAVKLASGAALGGAGSFDLDLAATTRLVTLRVDGARVELALFITDPQLRVGGAPAVSGDDPLVGSLGRPYVFTLDAGRMVEQRFAPGLSPVAAGIQATLAAAFELAQPTPEAPARDGVWTQRERDATGEYEAEYRVGAQGGVVNKRKLRYTDLSVAGKLDAVRRAQLVPTVTASSGELRVQDGTLVAVRLEDAVQSQVMAKTPVVVETKLSLARVAVPGGAGEGPRVDRAGLLDATIAQPLDRGYGDGRSHGLFDEVRLDGRSFGELLADLEAQAEAEASRNEGATLWAARNGAPVSDAERMAREAVLGRRVSTFAALVALLRVDPQVIDAAVAKARAGSPAARKLLDAVAGAGTAAAQAALADLVVDGTLARGIRIGAASSLIRVERPDPRLVQTLERLLADPLLAEHAVFGLGTAARHLREQGDEAEARRISERLLTGLAAARDKTERIRYLRGIANSAYEGAVDRIRPLTEADDSGVRRAAVEGVRLIEGPGADAYIAGPIANDPDARVRMAAIAVAARRAPSVVIESALTEAALHDANDVARQRAVELLGRWLSAHGTLRATLERVAASDSQSQVREAARAALTRT